MNRDDLFWERVNAALDERRDPLADEQVQTLVAECPERLDELLALQLRLENVTRRPRARKSRRVAAAVLVVAGALVVATVGAAVLWFAHGAHRSEPVAIASSDDSRVLSLHVSVVHETPELRTSRVFDGVRVVERTESLTPPRALASRQPANFVVLAESIAFIR